MSELEKRRPPMVTIGLRHSTEPKKEDADGEIYRARSRGAYTRTHGEYRVLRHRSHCIPRRPQNMLRPVATIHQRALSFVGSGTSHGTVERQRGLSMDRALLVVLGVAAIVTFVAA